MAYTTWAYTILNKFTKLSLKLTCKRGKNMYNVMKKASYIDRNNYIDRYEESEKLRKYLS